MFLLICFQKKEKSLTAHFACRAIDCKEGLKKMPAVNASEKAKKSRAWNADCVQAQLGASDET